MYHRRHRQSMRLRGYDYAQAGAYFVTLCTLARESLFGEVVDGAMCLNRGGSLVAEAWAWLGQQYPYLDLDEWVVMPNHVHGIIVLEDHGRGGSRIAPTEGGRKPLGRLIGAFKTVSSKRIKNLRAAPGRTIWQRNYYDHVIRGDLELDRIRQYIAENPLRWAEDEENPANISKKGAG